MEFDISMGFFMQLINKLEEEQIVSFEFDDKELITNIFEFVKKYGTEDGLDSYSLVPMTEFMKPSSC